MSYFVGWDIGGAHLKVVILDAQGQVVDARQMAAPVWQGLDYLRRGFEQFRDNYNTDEMRHGVTMTAELADCFSDRGSGVRALVDEVGRQLGDDTRVYSTHGLLDLPQAADAARQVASVNWHASASLVGRYYKEALLVDIGSTTADIIPIRKGAPASRGYTDRERLQHDELVYTGVVRTPVMAVVQRAVIGGTQQHLAAEQFAVMADVYRLLEELPEDADLMPTSDGGGRDISSSARRLARMACADLDDLPLSAWQAFARHIKHTQKQLLLAAFEKVRQHTGLAGNAPVIGAGCGRFLVKQLAEQRGYPYHDALDMIQDKREQHLPTTDMLPAYAVADSLYRAS